MSMIEDVNKIKDMTLDMIIIQDHALQAQNKINRVLIQTLRPPTSHPYELTATEKHMAMDEAMGYNTELDEDRKEVLRLGMEISSIYQRLTGSS